MYLQGFSPGSPFSSQSLMMDDRIDEWIDKKCANIKIILSQLLLL